MSTAASRGQVGDRDDDVVVGARRRPAAGRRRSSVIVRSPWMSSADPQLEQKLLSGGLRCPQLVAERRTPRLSPR